MNTLYSSFRLLLVLMIICPASFGQKLKRTDKLIISNLSAHVNYLADDKLEGRRAGTEGERLAGEYIVKKFHELGLKPGGNAQSWRQPFEINDGKQALPASHLIINKNDLRLFSDYFPFPFGASKSLEASVIMDLSEAGEPWFIDLKEILENVQNNPHADLIGTIRNKAVRAYDKGATALIVYNGSNEKDLVFNGARPPATVDIPVLYVTAAAAKKYLSDRSDNLDIKLKVEMGDKKRTGNNIIAFQDNKAPYTIVVGAHYDHIGFGEDGNSLQAKSPDMTHNGADDNASGVAGLIELARLLKQSKKKNGGSNYLFIAFSGEESGLYGSKYFTEHPTIDLQKVSCMLNMDMIGRLNEQSKTLTVGGYGTSPSWATALSAIPASPFFTVKYDSSGAGPSDHTSFYRKEIPVLFFFTGLHADYHKPSDDADKINFNGELHIVKYIFNIIENVNKMGKLAFLKTVDRQSSTSAQFSVTLGIMPDYTFNGAGVRVDGVSDERPAQKAGIRAGDIILRLSDYSTASLELYMQALSKFKKGERAVVKYKRGNELRQAEIRF